MLWSDKHSKHSRALLPNEEIAAMLPMDGFHLYRAQLDAMEVCYLLGNPCLNLSCFVKLLTLLSVGSKRSTCKTRRCVMFSVWSFHLNCIYANTNIIVINFSSVDIQSITFSEMSTDPKNRGIYQILQYCSWEAHNIWSDPLNILFCRVQFMLHHLIMAWVTQLRTIYL